VGSMIGTLNRTFTAPGKTWKGALIGPGLSSLVDPKPGTLLNPDGPKAPGAVPPTPTLGNSQDSLDEAARQQQMRIQRGLTSTLLTGGAGLSNTGSTSKVLLGG
jgi:hypothetical protein